MCFRVITCLAAQNPEIDSETDEKRTCYAISAFNGVVKSLDCCYQTADERQEFSFNKFLYLHTETNLNYAIKNEIKWWDMRWTRGRRRKRSSWNWNVKTFLISWSFYAFWIYSLIINNLFFFFCFCKNSQSYFWAQESFDLLKEWKSYHQHKPIWLSLCSRISQFITLGIFLESEYKIKRIVLPFNSLAYFMENWSNKERGVSIYGYKRVQRLCLGWVGKYLQ